MDIVINQLSKTFGTSTVLEDINLTVKTGQVYGLIGPNGAGKTTLTRTILDIYRPSSGTVAVNGIKSSDSSFNEIRKQIGCVLDQLGLYKSLTAWENIELFHRVFFPKASKQQRDKDINECIRMVDLEQHKDSKITFFSRGMRQRLALARAFIGKPQLLILDEPTRGLDVEGNYMLRNYIKEMKSRGLTVFINSHHLSELKKVCDVYGFIKNGKLIEEGNYSHLAAKYLTGPEEADMEKLYRFIFQLEEMNEMMESS
ncbi:ABC transporter ATP-binding protein [Paenibacillus sp. HW567]|uniref:ABC transporter ATP-binding protein n=1 Tax=Paenibacillus sp. HW567 TaxID=1034769 RepID=UPI000380B3C4|nr:ATP-binding cassette domain-containing protein [Paenibacillus sp. HW567]